MNKIKEFVEKKEFKNFILGVIVFNSIQLGLMTINDLNTTIYNILKYIDMACLVIYIVEMLLKFIAYNIIGYFKSLWNWFDFIIIIFSILSEFTVVSSLKVFRSFRIFRSLRSLRGFKLLSSVNSLQIIISAIGKALPGVAWTTALMLIVFYLFSIIGVTEFGKEFPDWFGTIPKTMYTLFQVMTMESWSMGISRPVMKEFSFAWLYFVPFIIVSAFVAMNIVVGIVVNSVSDVSSDCNGKDSEDEEKNDIEALKSELKIIKEHFDNLDEILKKLNIEDLEEYNKNISIKVKSINNNENI